MIALPAVLLFTRGDSSPTSAEPSFAAAGVESTQVAPPGSATASTEDPFGTEGPIFVDGPSTPPRPGVIQIVVPAQIEQGHIDGNATYKRTIGDKPDTCSATNAPYGVELTVLNRDNGRSVKCINRAPQVLAPGVEIMLTFDSFSRIGEIVDAPIPVRISWQGT